MKNTYLELFPVSLNKYLHLQVALHVWVVSCDFSRAIDMLAKLEKAFVSCEKSVPFLPISQLAKTLPMHSSVWASPETTQYRYIGTHLYPLKQPGKYRLSVFGLENLGLHFFYCAADCLLSQISAVNQCSNMQFNGLYHMKEKSYFFMLSHT